MTKTYRWKRKNRRFRKRRRRKTRKRGSGKPLKRTAKNAPPRTPTEEFSRLPRQSSEYYSARMNSPQAEAARQAVSKIMGNATMRVKRRKNYYKKKAGDHVRLVRGADDIFNERGRPKKYRFQPTNENIAHRAKAAGRSVVNLNDLWGEDGKLKGENIRPNQLLPFRGRIKSNKSRPKSGNAFNNDFASRHVGTRKKGRKRKATKKAFRAMERVLTKPFRFFQPSLEKKRNQAQIEQRKKREDWDDLLDGEGAYL